MVIDILIAPLSDEDVHIKGRELTRLLCIGCVYYETATDNIRQQIELDIVNITRQKTLRCRFSVKNAGRLGEEIVKSENRGMTLQRFFVSAKYFLNQDQKKVSAEIVEKTDESLEDDYIVPVSNELADFFAN